MFYILALLFLAFLFPPSFFPDCPHFVFFMVFVAVGYLEFVFSSGWIGCVWRGPYSCFFGVFCVAVCNGACR